MKNFAALLDRYADLVVRVGAGVQPGQVVFIGGGTPVPLEAAEFVRLLARKAYDAGARRVHVHWGDDEISRLVMARSSEEALAEYPAHLARWLTEAAEQNAAFISVYAPDPDLYEGIDPRRITVANKATAQALEAYKQYATSMKVSWTVVAAPTPKWAARVYPGRGAAAARDALWQAILQAVRVTAADPVAAWQAHLRQLGDRTAFLNDQRFQQLIYKGPGTDLTIDLPERHLWQSCHGTANARGTPFVPNLPSEEVFTLPRKTGVNGVVRSTMPLNLNGTLIQNMSLTFTDGRIVAYSADSGQEALQGLIETDAGAAFLGEVALVPVDSPICQTGVLFYNTLFDENASCHLAIGRAYPVTIAGGGEMSPDELAQHGANQSLAHVDFMIGSPELNIDGVNATGQVVPVFRSGTWAGY